MLFAGTAQPGMPGAIRAYPIGQGAPAGSAAGAGGGGGAGAGGHGGGGGGGGGGKGELNGDFQEYGCLSLAVSCMALNHDGSLLFVGGDDGVLAMYCVADDAKDAEKKVRVVVLLPCVFWKQRAGDDRLDTTFCFCL